MLPKTAKKQNDIRNALAPLPKPNSAAISLLGKLWSGKLEGYLRELELAWNLVFQLEIVGHQLTGSGFLCGSGTYGSSLSFSMIGDSRIDPATGNRNLIIAVTEPLPSGSQDAFMRFELSHLEFTPDKLKSHWHLLCMYPTTCGCSGASGDFAASKW